MRQRLGLVLCAVCVAVGIIRAQAPPPASQQPIFRGGANYVRIDMYASTGGGTPIVDLRADEVELLEDGVPQKIEAFEHVAVRATRPGPPGREPNTVEESRQMASEGRARILVLFLDTYHVQLQGSGTLREPLTRFLSTMLGPDDMVAIMTPETSARDLTFGRRTEVLQKIARDWTTWARSGRNDVDADPQEVRHWACYAGLPSTATYPGRMKERRRQKMTLDALEDLVVHLGGVREDRKAVIALSEGWQLFRPDSDLARPASETGPPRVDVFAPKPKPLQGLPGAPPTDQSDRTLADCERDRMALATMDSTRRLEDLAFTANRANVSFYPIYPLGLSTTDARVKSDNLRFLAENTDGMAAINTNAFDASFQRVLDDLSSYYLFGYYSTNAKLDGRFRQITVRVKRPGVQVRARKGYRAHTSAQVLAARTTVSAVEKLPPAFSSAMAAIVSTTRPLPFRVRASTWVTPGVNGAAGAGLLWVAGEIDAATRKQQAWAAGSRADVTVLAADGATIASHSVDVDPLRGVFVSRLPSGLSPGDYSVRVRVRPTGAPSEVMTDTARVALGSGATALGQPLLLRRGPSTGVQYVATADPRFDRTERIRLELPTRSRASASARVLDRAGNPIAVPAQTTTRPDADGDLNWVVVDLVLAPLAPGEYAIEVTLDDERQIAAFRRVP